MKKSRRFAVVITVGLLLMAAVMWVRFSGILPEVDPEDGSSGPSTGAQFAQLPDLAEFLQPWDQRADEAASATQKLVSENTVKTLEDIQFPTGDKVRTRHQESERYYAWASAELIAYDERMKKAPEPAQAAGRALLKKVYECECRLASRDNEPSISQLAQAALDANVPDLYTRFHAIRELKYDQPEAEVKAVREAAQKVLAGPTTLFERVMVRGSLRHLTRLKKGAEDGECLDNLLAELVQWIEQSADDPLQQQFVFAWIGAHWETTLEDPHWSLSSRHRVVARLLKAKRAHPWLMHMLVGMHHYNSAWNHRGGGVASADTRDSGNLFQKELLLATRHYLLAHQMHPEFPESATGMITIAMTGSENEMGTPALWFQRAITAEIDNGGALDRYFTTLDPRWGGSHEQMGRFAERCLETGRFDTGLPQWAITVLFRVQFKSLGARQSAFSLPWCGKLLERFNDGFWQAVEQRQKEPDKFPAVYGDEPRMRSLLAALSLKSGDYTTARRALEGIAQDNHWLTLGIRELFEPRELNLSALAAAADDEPFVKLLMTKLRFGFSDEITDAEFQSLIDDLAARQQRAANAPAKRFYAHSLAITKRAQAFQHGDWVPLTFEDDCAGWDITADDWQVYDDQAIRLTRSSDRANFACADCLNRFSPPFAVDVTVEYPNPTRPLERVGVAIGARDFEAMGGLWQSTRHYTVSRKQTVAGVFANSGLNMRQVFQISPINTHHIRVRAWPQWFTYAVDGYRGFNQRDEEFEAIGQLCFGSAHIPPDSRLGIQRGDVKLSNLRVRKLTVQPPPADPTTSGTRLLNLDEFEQYYERELTFDPDDAWAKFMLGTVRYDRFKYQGVPQLLQQAHSKASYLMLHGVGTMIASSSEELGDYDAAAKWYALQSEKTPADINLLWLHARFMATCPEDRHRDGAKALKLAEQACQQSQNQRWEPLYARATALAETGQFDKAIASMDESLAIAPEQNKPALTVFRDEFVKKKPFRRSTPPPAKE